jgi:hypothetical protein
MSQSARLWEARYRELEKQFEHAMLAVSDAWSRSSVEERGTAAPLSVRRIFVIQTVPRRVVCVADGVNIDYRFTCESDGEVVSRSEFQRSNTYILPESFRSGLVRAEVRSHGNDALSQVEIEVGQS